MNKNSDDWHAQGRELQIAGKWEKAICAYKKALKLRANRLDSHNNLAIIQRQRGLIEEANKLVNAGLKLASEEIKFCKSESQKQYVRINWARLYNSSSSLALQQNQYQRCSGLAKQQVQLEPEGCGYVNLGVALEGIGSPAAAARSHLIGLRRHNIGWKEPQELVGKALDNPAASTQLHRELVNLATSRLHEEPLSTRNWELLLSRLGILEQIWTMDELPWKRLWRGQICEDLLVWDEQGFGDALQCLRWVESSAARTKNLTLMLRPELINLVKQRLLLPRNCKIIALSRSGAPLTRHQKHCPLMGLPVALADGQGRITTPKPLKGHWLDRKNYSEKNKKIGLVWAAGQKVTEDAQRASERRSVSAEQLLKHALTWRQKWNAELYSLQVKPENTLVTDLLKKGKMKGLDEGGDWESTAKLVEKLDLVVSVDTAMVHLAGNLGVPCLLLLNQVHDWRWGTEKEPERWYPRQTVLRCKRKDDWERLLQEADSWVNTLLNK